MDTLSPVLFGIEYDGTLLAEVYTSEQAAKDAKASRDADDRAHNRGPHMRRVVPLGRLDQAGPRPTLLALKRFWDAHIQDINVNRGTLDALDALIRADERALVRTEMPARVKQYATPAIDAVVRKAEAFDALRAACGYVENGTSCAVTVSQDDATKGWTVRAGHNASFSDDGDLAATLIGFITKYPPEA